MNYPVGDFLIRIKNAALAGNHQVTVGNTKLVNAVAKAMKKLDYLDNVSVANNNLTVDLSYRRKQPVILNLKLVSKPGLRIYKTVDELEAMKGPSTVIITTPNGVLGKKEAIKKRVGGEVIVEIW